MASPLSDLLALLDLEPLEVNLFRGESRRMGSERVYGGQVLAQSLVAAGRTVDEARYAHSMHAYFMLPGDVEHPIVYQVERLRDGGSFTTRRVTAIQHGRPIFNAALSFHKEEEGFDHQAGMPHGLPKPEALQSEAELARGIADMIPEPVRELYTTDRPIETRPVDPVNPFAPEPSEPVSYAWLRAAETMGSDDRLHHQALLAYASDYGLLGAALRPHAHTFFEPNLQAASLDHAIWFHRPFRMDEWLLYTMEGPSAFGARGFTRGSVHTRDGRLVASVAQEGLIRWTSDADAA